MIFPSRRRRILNVDYDKDYQGLNEKLLSLDAPQGWQYTSLESPNGEAGFLLMFNKTLKPYRLKIKTPSLSLAQALPNFVSGISEEQLKVCLASFGIRNFEMDR